MSESAFRLVLASASPRRRELLARLGLQFVVDPPAVDESPTPGEPAPVHALRIAWAKGWAVAGRHPSSAILAADTAVVVGDRLLGKPAGRGDATEMLTALAGRTHFVVTAVTLIFGARHASHVSHVRVRFVPYAESLYRWYAATGEGDDKAGAYALQGKGALLVEAVEGNVQAVVGLPLAQLPALFLQVGLELSPDGAGLVVGRSKGPLWRNEGVTLAR